MHKTNCYKTTKNQASNTPNKKINNDGLTITSGYKSIRSIGGVKRSNNNILKFSLIFILGNQ